MWQYILTSRTKCQCFGSLNLFISVCGTRVACYKTVYTLMSCKRALEIFKTVEVIQISTKAANPAILNRGIYKPRLLI